MQIIAKVTSSHGVHCHIHWTTGNVGFNVRSRNERHCVHYGILIKQTFVPGVWFVCVPVHSDVPFEDQMTIFDNVRDVGVARRMYVNVSSKRKRKKRDPKIAQRGEKL